MPTVSGTAGFSACAEPFVLVDQQELAGREAERALAVLDHAAAGAVGQGKPGRLRR